MTAGAETCKWHQKLSFVPDVFSVVSAVAGTCVAGAYSQGIVCEIHGLLSPSLWRKSVDGLIYHADKITIGAGLFVSCVALGWV